MCIKFESEEISKTGDDCSKSYSKEEEVRSIALRVDEAMDCQQGEAKHSYRGFVTVVTGIIIIVLLLALFRRVGVYILVFVLRVIVFHVIIYVAMLCMNYPQCRDCAFSASFVRECTYVSYIAGEGVELTVHK